MSNRPCTACRSENPRSLIAVAGPLFARGEDRAERCGGCGILNDAGERRGQTDHLAEPLHHPFLELGRCRRRRPAHALRAEGGGEHLGENGRRTAVGRKVGEERRVLPVGHPREDDGPEVAEDAFERLRLRPADPAGSCSIIARGWMSGLTGSVHPRQVVRHPVDEFMAVCAEFFGVIGRMSCSCAQTR